MNKVRFLFIISGFFTSSLAFSQMLSMKPANFIASDKMEADQTFLIESPVLKNEADLIMNELYNLQFNQVEKRIDVLKREFSWHPLPYFLQSLSNYWQIISNPGNEEFDEVFLTHVEKTIDVAEALYDDPKYRSEASFFLSASYGLKSQLFLDRKSWTKFAVVGKSSLRYLKEIKKKDDINIELLFGQGLYNYYADWIPEEYPILKSVVWMLPDGNIELGKEQLTKVYEQGFYTRIEAAVYLIEILSRSTLTDKLEALKIAQDLSQQYPGNTYFLSKAKQLALVGN